jgi:hypothetical protein
MKRRIIVGLVIALMLVSTFGAFAASNPLPWIVSYNKAGQLDLTLTGGYSWYGFGANVGAELFLGQFDIAGIPLSWGITAKGSAGFGGYGIGISAGALATLNIGFDFGSIWKFESFVGIGLGVLLDTWGSSSPFGIGLAQNFGWTWWFSKNIGLTAEQGYIDAFLWGSWYYYGLGVTFKL